MPKKLFLVPAFFFVFLILIFYLLLSRSPVSFISPLASRLSTHLPTPTPASVSIVAVGDIMLGRNVNKKMHDYDDFLYPFRKTADFLSGADITFGNLESPFFDQCPVVGSGTFKFCGDYRSVEGLKTAGFDVLSLENNHILNYGEEGLKQTVDLLRQNNISPSTANEITIKRANEITFGFLSFSYDRNLDQALEKVKQEKDKVDVLIVSLHWGAEYKTKPAKSQVDLAHQLIDSGVKVILGHHSHWVGEVEHYQNGLIFYSLGNFVFDQMWSEETKKRLVAKINFEGKKIKDFQTYQVLISDYSQPSF